MEMSRGSTLAGSVYSTAIAPPPPDVQWPSPPFVSITPAPEMRPAVIQIEPPPPARLSMRLPFARIAPSFVSVPAWMRTAPPPLPAVQQFWPPPPPSSIGR
jgi:hypothetical protein